LSRVVTFNITISIHHSLVFYFLRKKERLQLAHIRLTHRAKTWVTLQSWLILFRITKKVSWPEITDSCIVTVNDVHRDQNTHAALRRALRVIAIYFKNILPRNFSRFFFFLIYVRVYFQICHTRHDVTVVCIATMEGSNNRSSSFVHAPHNNAKQMSMNHCHALAGGSYIRRDIFFSDTAIYFIRHIELLFLFAVRYRVLRTILPSFYLAEERNIKDKARGKTNNIITNWFSFARGNN